MKRAARQFDGHQVALMVVAALVLMMAFTGVIFAQDSGPSADQNAGQTGAYASPADPPGRAARLAVAEGQVSLQPEGMEDWAATEANRPLTNGDKVWVDAASRAEIDAGSAVIRLGAATGFAFLNLDDRVMQMRLAAGTAIIHVRQLLDGETSEVDTPNLAVTLQRAGIYRIAVNGAGDTTSVEVVEGSALVANATESFPVERGQEAVFTGIEQLTSNFIAPPQPDNLDIWSMQRDASTQESDARRYVADDIPGAGDLDSYGQWEYLPDYGYAWTPVDVAPGWAPYSVGSGTWVAPWGWTWVDRERWGYAPFHYGRWLYWGARWRWIPGPRQARACFAPALVAWGGGTGPGVAAWFPLAPHEPYVPAYGVSGRYLARINPGAPLYPGRPPRYANLAVAGAVTAVPHEVFAAGRPIRGTERLPPGAFTLEGASATAPPIAPARQSVLGAGGRPAVHPGGAVFMRPVVARMTPPVPAASFERQRAAVVANGNRPLAPAQMLHDNGRVAVVHALPPAPAAGSALAGRPEDRAPREAPLETPRGRPPLPPAAPQLGAPRPAPPQPGAFRSNEPGRTLPPPAPARPQSAPLARAPAPHVASPPPVPASPPRPPPAPASHDHR